MSEIQPRIIRAPNIRGLTPQLPERGKIKIGAKGPERPTRSGSGTWQPPVKLDHFVITTLDRGKDGNLIRDEEIHALLGDKPTEIPVRLLYDDPDLNFASRYACYKGRTLWCTGDGETASRLAENNRDRIDIACPCILSDPSYQGKDKCKMNGSLSVIIDGAAGLGGVWKFRTTSYNSIVKGIMSSMAFLKSITGGPLANIPLVLRLHSQQATNPITGEAVQIYVVRLEFKGSMDDLRDAGHQIALARATTHLSIAEIETEARKRLTIAAPLNAPLPGDDEADDIVSEFYPEQYDDETGEVWGNGQKRPTRSQFRTPTPQDAPEEDETSSGVVVNEEGTGSRWANPPPPSPADPPPPTPTPSIPVFVISHADGTETAYPGDDAEGAADTLITELHARADERGREGLDSVWLDNRALWGALYQTDQKLTGRVAAEYQAILANLAPPPPSPPKTTTRTRSTEHPEKGRAGPGSPAPLPPSTPREGGFHQEPAAVVSASPLPAPPQHGGTGSPSQDGPSTNEEPADIIDLHESEAAREEVIQSSAVAPAPDQTEPGAGADDAPAERDIAVKTITYGPGRGTNWRATEEAVVTMVRTLTKPEYLTFRQRNSKLLATMGISWKDGMTRVNRALIEREEALGGISVA